MSKNIEIKWLHQGSNSGHLHASQELYHEANINSLLSPNWYTCIKLPQEIFISAHLYSIALNTSYNKRKITVHFLSFQFVSHPNCQQLLASLWYEGLPGFRRHNIVSRLLITFMIGFTFPLLSLFYLIAPKSRFGKLIRKPFIKFICHSASYITFLGKLFFSFWTYLLKLYKVFYDFIINIIKIRNVNCQIDMYSDFLINFRADSTKSLTKFIDKFRFPGYPTFIPQMFNLF